MNTEIIVIMDRSGSMEKIATDAIGGFNALLTEQIDVPGEARMSLVLFDHVVELRYEGVDVINVASLDKTTFVPRGMTALIDAIGETLTVQKARIQKAKWADTVIVAIITDGEENCSKTYTNMGVKELVQSCEDLGWKFIYMGANQDAFTVASKYGISAATGGVVASFDATDIGTRSAYGSISASVTLARTSGINDADVDLFSSKPADRPFT